MNIVAIIQARMKSTRLPGKVMLPLAGKPALQWVIDRVSRSKKVTHVMVSTGHKEDNIEIYDYWNRTFDEDKNEHCWNLEFYRDEKDVLGRVLYVADNCHADTIVDITADCPLVDPKHIDYLIDLVQEKDYASNVVWRSFPDGFDVQVYTIDTLRKINEMVHGKYRQHAGWNITRYPEIFKIVSWVASRDLYYPHWRLTLDTPQDYCVLVEVCEAFKDLPEFTVRDVVQYLQINKHILEMNSNIIGKQPGE